MLQNFQMVAAVCDRPSGDGDGTERYSCFRAATPAGTEVILLKPSGAVVTVLGLAECPEIAGAQQVDHGLQAKVVWRTANPWNAFRAISVFA